MRADRHLEKYMTVTESKGNQKKKKNDTKS